jgi:hypothetical protein
MCNDRAAFFVTELLFFSHTLPFLHVCSFTSQSYGAPNPETDVAAPSEFLLAAQKNKIGWQGRLGICPDSLNRAALLTVLSSISEI